MLAKKKDKLLDLALDGLLSKEDLNNKNISIETEISKIQVKLKELEGKKKKPEEEEKEQNKKLKESILKELTISKDNLENYIEELLDKIIVVEKAKTINEAQIKENNTQKSEKQKQKAQLDKKETKQNECEIELKIILAGNKIITYGSASKLRQISQLGRLRGTDYKKVPLCHSHAHS